MAAEESLFGNYKQCEFCGRSLPLHYELDLCPQCTEARLFQDVKEYIRANIVNEYQVASYFHIPLKQVRSWIKEGRIEYRAEDPSKAVVIHCMHCGAPITFGTLCTKCLKALNGGKGFSTEKGNAEESRMRFLDSNSKDTN